MASDLFDSAIGKPEKQQFQTQQGPWVLQQEPLNQLFQNAGRLYNQGGFSYAPSPYTQQSQQMMQLVHGFFGSTQRQNRNAEITRPLKDAAQTGLTHIQNILTCAAMRDIERDLQFTVCDRHPSGCW